MEKESSATKHYTIFINDLQFHVDRDSMTGIELKVLGGVNPANRLFLEGHGSHPDRPIGDGETVELKSGDKFYDLPPGVVGADVSC